MLRNMIRRSGMLALVLALALAGTAPASALGFGFEGRDFDGWHAVWNWLEGVLGWGDEGSGNSGGVSSVYEGETAGIDPNGNPVATTTTCGPDETCGIDPNGAH